MVGSLNTDLVVRTTRRPDGGETVVGSDLQVGPGGKSANQAVAAARLGADVAMIGAVGDDVFGTRLREAIGVEGIDQTAVVTLEEVATGTAVIVVDSDGENSIVVSPGANRYVDGAFVQAHRTAFDGAGAVVLCLEIPLDGAVAAARAGHAVGATVIVNLSPYAAVPPELLRLTDLLLVNEHELKLLVGGGARDQYAAALADMGIERAIVTLGERGSEVVDGASGIRRIEPVRVGVVDTTGCGDAYTGAVAAALVRGLSLVDAADVANRISADAATREGASTSYPTAADAARLAWGGPERR